MGFDTVKVGGVYGTTGEIKLYNLCAHFILKICDKHVQVVDNRFFRHNVC